MPKISYIAGIGQTEKAQRAAELKPQPFIPYLSLTQGEMSLALMQEQANILAAYTGSAKYRQAETMLDNALNRGIHGATPYLGAYDADLGGVARAIQRAARQTRPAAGALLGRQSRVSGIHIGEPLIDTEQRYKDCLKAAGGFNPGNVAKCQARLQIEKIINDGIENCGQYLAYGYLPSNNNLPSIALYKLLDQTKGQEDIARVGEFSISLTQQWLNVGMMRRNADTAKVGPLGWIPTNSALTSLPEAGQKEVEKLLTDSVSKWGAPASAAMVGNQLASIVRKYQDKSIGFDPATTVAIIAAITALIGGISEFAKQLRSKKQDAFAQVNGFGARSFGPQEGDWDGDGIPDNQQQGSGLSTPLIIGGVALAAWALTK